MYDLQLTDSEKARFLEAARLCGAWLVNCQNTNKRPWGSYRVRLSVDLGRYMEKAIPAAGDYAPVGVWLTGLYLAGLTSLAATPVIDRKAFAASAELGVDYLLRLQCWDSRWDKAIGGFHEMYPGHDYSAPRDAATGAMGLIAMHLHTGDADYLDRAIRFAEWYSTFGSDPDGYPWDDFNLATGTGTHGPNNSGVRGDWQAGGALLYFQLHQLTGEQKWADALVGVLEVLEVICANDPGTDTAYDFHGNCTVSVGNDDFANTALMAGYRLTGEARFRDLAAARLRTELARQDERGAFPGYGGTGVTALELIEALDLAEAGTEILPPDELAEPLLRAGRFLLSQQVRTGDNRFMLGGVFGQGNYSHTQDVVHGRDTSYALQLWLRLAGRRAATYTTLGWRPA